MFTGLIRYFLSLCSLLCKVHEAVGQHTTEYRILLQYAKTKRGTECEGLSKDGIRQLKKTD